MISYVNGDWLVSISLDDGTKKRESWKSNPVAAFPESMDVKITDYCDAGCAWCHENSTIKGKHGDIERVKEIYSYLPRGVEIAIGGGNPLSHPEIVPLLEWLRDHGYLANLTMNEFHMRDKKVSDTIKDMMDNDLIKGLGYSYQSSTPMFHHPNMVIHLIAGVHPPTVALRLLRDGFSKILLLGYKFFRRGNSFARKNMDQVESNIRQWKLNMPLLLSAGIQISMDNLAIEQMEPRKFLGKRFDLYYMGDDGSHTMYYDAVNNEFAITSTSTDRVRNNGGDSFIRFFQEYQRKADHCFSDHYARLDMI